MAEIFGAVASGAGLISLAVQILESSQKLKAFHNASKDAPQAVADLSYELETMSLSLRQLEAHRRSDVLGDELLGRCILTFTKMVEKIERAVSKIDDRLQRSRMLGRLSAAFKEPEIRKLLQDLEHAKSSMLFAYMSYCHMREASDRITTIRTQNELLLSHRTRLEGLDSKIEAGRADILSQIGTLGPLVEGPPRPVSLHTTRRSSRRYRLTLPRWFTETVWELGVNTCEDGWDFQLRQINIRPYATRAFDAVRSGNVGDVKRLLASGELSVSDCEYDYHGKHKALLTIAAEAGRFDLCDFLLQEFSHYHSNEILLHGLNGYLVHYWPSASQEAFDHVTEAFYKLFIGKHGLQIDLQELAQHQIALSPTDILEKWIVYSDRLTKATLREVIESQAVPFGTWSFTQRFSVAVSSKDWSPEIFEEMVRPGSLTNLAKHQDFRGRTALHWAAEQFALNFNAECYEMRHHSLGPYGKQSVKLIHAGADCHALDSTFGTPFARVMQQSYLQGYQLSTRSSLAEIVRHWGYVVGSACALDWYVERENSLQARRGDRAPHFRVQGISNIWTYKLLVSDSSELMLEVEGSLQIPMWEFRPPPGAWERTCSKVDRIPWKPSPYFEDDAQFFWQLVGRVISRPTPILMREDQLTGLSLTKSFLDAMEEWIRGVQDDHGFIATKSRECRARLSEHKRRRRSASVPALPIPVEGRSMYSTEDTGYSTRGHWASRAHKCPLGMCWKYSCDSFPSEPNSFRRCMQGRCDDWEPIFLDTNRWQVKLIEEQSNVKIARRFADRFHPDWRNIVDENYMKARRGIMLGPGPAMRCSP